MKRMNTVALAAILCLSSACTTTEKLAAQQPYDLQMNCHQIMAELAHADTVLKDAKDDKGVNVSNVAAVLLFWPAAVGNYINADKSEDMALARRQNLSFLAQRQGCRFYAPRYASAF